LSSDKRSFRVHGKGNKMRVCFMGQITSDLIARHLKKEKTAATDPVFISDRFKEQRKPFSRSGLLQLLNRLSEAAGIYPLVSVHQMRRTFAVTILRNGANLPSVQRLMGHTTLAMTQRYLLLAQADIEAQHRAYSPRDNLKGKRNR
jgi:site-specific recombinase XerD